VIVQGSVGYSTITCSDPLFSECEEDTRQALAESSGESPDDIELTSDCGSVVFTFRMYVLQEMAATFVEDLTVNTETVIAPEMQQKYGAVTQAQAVIVTFSPTPEPTNYPVVQSESGAQGGNLTAIASGAAIGAVAFVLIGIYLYCKCKPKSEKVFLKFNVEEKSHRNIKLAWQFGDTVAAFAPKDSELPSEFNIFKKLQEQESKEWEKTITSFNLSNTSEEDLAAYSNGFKLAFEQFSNDKLRNALRSTSAVVFQSLLMPLAHFDTAQILSGSVAEDAKDIRMSLGIIQRACDMPCLKGYSYYMMDLYLGHIFKLLYSALKKEAGPLSLPMWSGIQGASSLSLRLMCTRSSEGLLFDIHLSKDKGFSSHRLILKASDFLQMSSVRNSIDEGAATDTQRALLAYQTAFTSLSKLDKQLKNGEADTSKSLSDNANYISLIKGLASTPDFRNKTTQIRAALSRSLGSSVSAPVVLDVDAPPYNSQKNRRSDRKSVYEEESPYASAADIKRERKRDERKGKSSINSSGSLNPIASLKTSSKLKIGSKKAHKRAKSAASFTSLNSKDLEKLGLPAGWRSAFDSKRKRVYYYNPKSGQRQWKPPQGSIAEPKATFERPSSPQGVPSPPRSPEMPLHHRSKSGVQKLFNKARKQDEMKRARKHKRSKSTAVQVAPGWFAAFDVKRNKIYYFNPKTGKRTWKKPKEVAETESRKSLQSSHSVNPIVSMADISGKMSVPNMILAESVEDLGAPSRSASPGPILGGNMDGGGLVSPKYSAIGSTNETDRLTSPQSEKGKKKIYIKVSTEGDTKDTKLEENATRIQDLAGEV